MKWLCIQIGRREHYAIPRALRRNGQDVRLITDFWYPNWNFRPPFSTIVPKAMIDRRASEDVGNVTAFNISCAANELFFRAKASGFERALLRNKWFEKKVERHLAGDVEAVDAVFAYSYAASAAIRFAKSRKVPFILGQIDGGLYEEELLARGCGGGKKAPANYWSEWAANVDTSDVVVVNSEWSAECLIRSGRRPKRVEVIPLGYESPTRTVKRPVGRLQFTHERPLKVLFLGQIVSRKGIVPLLEAAHRAYEERLPIKFSFVGAGEKCFVDRIKASPNAEYHDHIVSGEVGGYYATSDIFILPTISDGFAITQLEAQSYGLPIIASKHCGQVVQSGENGLVLEEVSSKAILESLRLLIAQPKILQSFQENSAVASKFNLTNIGSSYVSLFTPMLRED